jgi:hypothetical protein
MSIFLVYFKAILDLAHIVLHQGGKKLLVDLFRPHCSPSRRKEIASWLVIVATANVHEEDEEEKGKETIPTHPPNNTRTMTSKMRATKSRNPNQRADWWWDAQSAVCRIGSTQELWQVVSMILHLRTYPFQHIFFSCPSQWHTLRFDLLQLIEGF